MQSCLILNNHSIFISVLLSVPEEEGSRIIENSTGAGIEKLIIFIRW